MFVLTSLQSRSGNLTIAFGLLQALFYQALRFARDMLVQEDGVAQDLKKLINSRLSALLFHIQEYYWLDLRKLNEIYRYKTEEYSYDAVNKFNIYPDQVSPWLFEWIPNKGGYFIGNLQPAHMDFRFFSLGNLWSICGSLATKTQAEDILELMEAKWDDLIGTMPLKICFPALAEDEWRIITGSDPKNTYHFWASLFLFFFPFSSLKVLYCCYLSQKDIEATHCLERWKHSCCRLLLLVQSLVIPQWRIMAYSYVAVLSGVYKNGTSRPGTKSC
jgi:hypothetical protein